MSSIVTNKGDTFDLLARRAYGDDQKSSLLRSANPGLVEPFEAGVTVTVPTPPEAPTGSGSADNESEVALSINGKRFKFWTQIEINRSIDAMDSLTLAAPFDPDDPEFRAAFRPFGFNPVSVQVGGRPLFTGVMLTPNPDLTEKSRTVSAVCYSSPAVLGDCTAPASSYPLEWSNARLTSIAADMARPFAIETVFDSDAGAAFERVATKPGDRVLPFLVNLAQQRGLLVSSTEAGELLFAQSVEAGQPVAVLEEGKAPLVDVTPIFNPQEYYSEVTGIEPVVVGLEGGQVTVRNPRLPGVVRPYAFQVNDTLNADIRSACEAKTGRMFANVVNYTIAVATWRDPQGNLWEPNTTLVLKAPGAMVYNNYEFLIRGVTLLKTSDGGEVARIALTLPGAFSSQIPESLPWD